MSLNSILTEPTYQTSALASFCGFSSQVTPDNVEWQARRFLIGGMCYHDALVVHHFLVKGSEKSAWSQHEGPPL